MIQAVVFDFDDVLVSTERLKALSYVKAIHNLCNRQVSEEEVLGILCRCPDEELITEEYERLSGRSRKDMASELVDRFELSPYLASYIDGAEIKEPWQALVHVRLPIYEQILSDEGTIKESRIVHNIGLLHYVKKKGFGTALATMSERKHVEPILNALGLSDIFDEIVTGEDVSKGKPDPEIYLLVAKRLKVSPPECVVVEDSIYGVQAAIEAGMKVLAVPTPKSRERILKSGLVDQKWIINSPETLIATFEELLGHVQKDI